MGPEGGMLQQADTPGVFVLNKVVVSIDRRLSEICAPDHWWCPQKSAENFLEADFGGFAGTLRAQSKWQRPIVLDALGRF